MAGADEAGRGSLAGPLVAAAVLIDYERLGLRDRRALGLLDDSKQRSAEERADVNFVKRVVAGPGDRIAIEDGHVILNGRRQQEDFIRPCGAGSDCDFPREITVPADHYFMMGDNRGASDDSRFWGPVPRKWIIGGAFGTYWPPDRIGLL